MPGAECASVSRWRFEGGVRDIIRRYVMHKSPKSEIQTKIFADIGKILANDFAKFRPSILKNGHARVETRVLKTLACRSGFWTSCKQW